MTSIKIKTIDYDNQTEIRLLINHPMENGRNRDVVTGELIPAHYIEKLLLKLNGKLLINVNMNGGMAKNPYFTFKTNILHSGDVIHVYWQDNLQSTDEAAYVIN